MTLNKKLDNIVGLRKQIIGGMRDKFETEEMRGRAEVAERKHSLEEVNDCKDMFKNRAKNEDVVNIYKEKNERGRAR